MNERRAGKFTEVISLFMLRVAAIGAVIVLIDVQFTIVFAGQTISIGSGFSADLKGAVITAILISGWTAVKEFWLGASASGENQAESMSRIAEASAPVAAAAAAAASSSSAPLIEAEKVTVNNAPPVPTDSTKGPTT